MQFPLRCTTCLLLLASSLPLAAIVSYTEPPDLPNGGAGTLFALDPGTNTIAGTVHTPADGQDRFQVTVPPGFRLTTASRSFTNSSSFLVSPAVTFNGETLSGTGTASFSSGYPLGPGTYSALVAAGVAVNDPWSTSFTVEAIPDYTVTTSASILTLTDVSGNGDTLTVSQPSSGNIRFSVPGRVFKLDANLSTPDHSGDIPLAGISFIVINTAAGSDTINVGAFANFDTSLAIDAGTGDDTVNLNGNLGFFPGKTLDIDLQDDDPNPGTDRINVAAGAQIAIPGTGSITFRCSRNIEIGSSALVRTQAGEVRLEANQQTTPTPGNFQGVRLAGGTVRCDEGPVIVKGRGGDDPGGFQIGVDLFSSGKIESYIGSVTVEGNGGPSAGFLNRGVTLNGAGTLITSGGPSLLSVTGTAGADSSSFGIGVAVINGSKITHTGTGDLRVTGTGTTNNANATHWGVEVGGSGSEISSSGFASINGTSGPGGGPGLQIADSALISTSGTPFLRLVSNHLFISNDASVNAGAGPVILFPASGHSLDIGGSSSPGVLGVGDAVLDRITTPRLVLNGANRPLVLSAPVSPASVARVELLPLSNNPVVPSASGTDLSVNGPVSLQGPASLAISVNGPVPDIDYSRLVINGGVELSIAVALQITATYPGTPGEVFTIVENDGSDPVSGTFSGLPEGALTPWPASILNARISYAGGDGNDITLTLVDPFLVSSSAATGPGSLRDAIATAATQPGPDTITFDPAVFATTTPPVIQLDEVSGQLLIDSDLTLDASAIPGGVVIDGGSNGDFVLNAGETRCLLITDNNASTELAVTLRNLTIRNGVFNGANAGANLHNRENLTLEDCTISGGRAFGEDADGGGIYSQDASLTLIRCTVSGNQTNGDGADGGGIFSQSASLTLIRCTVSGNRANGAGANGGGIISDTDLTNVETSLLNCTIHANTAEERGGGIFNVDGLTRLDHCTITANQSANNSGGGVASFGDSLTVTRITSSIIRDNLGDTAANDVQFVSQTTNSFVSQGFNHVGTGNALGNFFLTTDRTGDSTPILLAPLGNYGGPTETRPPLPGSPVVDRRTTLGTPDTDQRGAPRGVGNGTDSGAVEIQPSIVLNADDSGPGSLRDTILFASPEMTVTFDPAFFASAPVIALGSEIPVGKSLTVDASDIPGGVIIDGGSDGDNALEPGENRCFLIDDGSASAAAVSFFNLMIQNGAAEAGGNILNSEDLTLRDCVISGGRAIAEITGGGGIYHLGGSLALFDCTVRDNLSQGSAVSVGGGIFAAAPLTLRGTTISGNQASGSGLGGGLASQSEADLFHCTIHGNTSSSAGGGFLNLGGNNRFIHCTVTENTSSTGGGIQVSGTNTTEMTSTLVRDNPGGDVGFSDINAVFTSLGGNIVGTGSALPAFTATGDQTGTATPIQLAPLASYGGRTEVRYPLAGSPAIDAGADAGEIFDQRGLPRDAMPDVGAVEASQLVVTTPVDENGSLETGFGTSLREAIAAAPNGGTVTFDDTVFPATITLINGALILTRPLTITAASISSGVTVSGDDTSRVFTIDSPTGPTVTLDTLHIRDGRAGGSTFPNNVGGNIYVASGESLILRNSTVSHGFANSFGGGIGAYGTVEALNSTLALNESASFGGAILADGSVTLNHCTVVENTSANTGGIRKSASGSLTLTNSIVAGNAAGDISSTYGNNGNNLIGGDPRLAPLGSYAGGTPSLPPLPGSPAIEGAVFIGPLTPTTDQLGSPRPTGPLPDLGAVEALPLGSLSLADSDSDDIPDILEGPGGPYSHLTVGSDDSVTDTDGDGITDADEIAAMTDLADASDFFHILSFSPAPTFHPVNNPLFNLTLSTFPGIRYGLETSASLTNFFPTGSVAPVTATGFTTSFQLFLLPNRDFVRGTIISDPD